MSNLKDTDFEDLFRRASEKYPLRTDSADWDRMAAALEKDPPEPPDGDEVTEKRRKRRFLWLFLLLPLAGGGYYVLQGHGHRMDVAGTSTVRVGTGGNEVSGGGAHAKESAGGAATTSAGAAVPVGGQATRTAGGTAISAGATSTAAGTTATTGGANGTIAHHRGESNGTRSGAGNDVFAGADEVQHGADVMQHGADVVQHGANGEQPWSLQGAQLAFIPRDYNLYVKVTAPAAKAAATDSSHGKKSMKSATTKHFYAGVIGAPDLSTVRMQAVKGTGSTFGLLLGYSFNPRWAIETGVYVDRKRYYTDGEYFSTKGVNLPNNSDLLNVNGVCFMWEIPLNVRYNFNPGAKTAWFATAGFSTYLMSHENYDYAWKWNYGTYVHDSTWNIKQPSQYPFSIINLSAGFQQRLGKVGNLRLEPYVRIPLTGMGTGKLPIMSVGVNIGITRQLW